MENASKALIMAGGLLIAILLVSLLLYAWSMMSKYQASKNEIKNIEDVAKFNEQFTNYDRDDVEGYEIISLANRVADYNNKYSSASDSKNDIKYNPITITIKIGNSQTIKDYFTRDDNIRFFKDQNGILTTIIQSKVYNQIEELIEKAGDMASIYGGEEALSSITKNIQSIFRTNAELDQLVNSQKNITKQGLKVESIKKFNALLKNSTLALPYDDAHVDSSYNTLMTNTNYYENAYKYYEYKQFKRAVFKCNNVTYDTAKGTGRVTSMEFEFTKKIR